MKHPGGRPTKLTEELRTKAWNYIYVADQGEPFGTCAGWTTDGSVIPTVEGFASYLLISRETVYDWSRNDKGFSDIVDEIKNQQANMLINGGLSNKYNATIAKLILSGKHGYVEKTETKTELSGEIKTGESDPKVAAEFAEFLKNRTKQE